jgi:four helix bundle protein
LDTNTIRGHRDLAVWQAAMDLAKAVYAMTADFPTEERYGLVSQMRRAAVSVPSNIAEGAGRGGAREFHQFLSIARGSLSELETQALLACDLGFMRQSEDLMNKIARIFRMIGGLQRSLKENDH